MSCSASSAVSALTRGIASAKRLTLPRLSQVALRDEIGGATVAVEHVRSQYDVAPVGDPLAHLRDPRSQPDGVHEEQHAGVLAAAGGTGDVPSGVQTTTPSATPSSVAFPQPVPSRPRVSRPFTATILADGTWIRARVTLTAIDTYRGKPFPELDGTPLLFRWKATNVDDHPLPATNDPVQMLRACSVQTVAKGARLDRAAFLSGDVRNPQTAEFRLAGR